MDWKELFKPDWGKIVIFVIVLILANLPIVGYTTQQVMCKPCPPEHPCPCPPVMVLRMVFYPFLQSFSGHHLEMSAFTYGIPLLGIVRYIILWPFMNVNIFYVLLSFLLLILNIVYWYLISCAIVGIYGVLKRKL